MSTHQRTVPTFLSRIAQYSVWEMFCPDYRCDLVCTFHKTPDMAANLTVGTYISVIWLFVKKFY